MVVEVAKGVVVRRGDAVEIVKESSGRARLEGVKGVLIKMRSHTACNETDTILVLYIHTTKDAI